MVCKVSERGFTRPAPCTDMRILGGQAATRTCSGGRQNKVDKVSIMPGLVLHDIAMYCMHIIRMAPCGTAENCIVSYGIPQFCMSPNVIIAWYGIAWNCMILQCIVVLYGIA